MPKRNVPAPMSHSRLQEQSDHAANLWYKPLSDYIWEMDLPVRCWDVLRNDAEVETRGLLHSRLVSSSELYSCNPLQTVKELISGVSFWIESPIQPTHASTTKLSSQPSPSYVNGARLTHEGTFYSTINSQICPWRYFCIFFAYFLKYESKTLFMNKNYHCKSP